ncbi:MAG: TonB-dependent receptor, partial [Sphingomonadaceae bacterium]
MKTILPRLMAATALVAITAAAPAIAQDQPEDVSASADAGDIVVTARKRSELVEDIPLSINVVGEDTIEKLGAQNYTDLLRTVPSLSAYQNGPGRTRISIRGIANGGGNDNDTQNQETVGIYIDEVPVSSGALNPEIALFDVERVEVLRGPQGTLYGAGSMTGTVRLVTRRPNLEEIEGKVEGSLSTIAHGGTSYDAKGLINVPIIQGRLGARATAYYTHSGGYIDNIATGKKDVNRGTAKGGRLVVRGQLSEDFTADLSYFHHEYSDKGRPEDLVRVPGFGRDYVSFDGFDDRLDIFNGTLNYDAGFASIVSSTSYFDRKSVNRRSLDSLLALFPVTPHELVDTTKLKFFAQELRVASQGEGPFQWIVGGYLDHKDVNYLNTFPVPGFDAAMGIDSTAFGAPKDFPYFGYDDLTVKTYALFGELTYKLGRLTATGGLRYFNWRQRYKYYQSGFFNGPVAADPPARKSKEDGFNPKVNLSYDVTDDTLVYAQAARGFRYGGVNGAIPEAVCATELADIRRDGGDPTVFDSDHLWNYEVGTKGRYADGKVTFNATAFYIKWSDIQTARGLTCGFGFRENVGAVTSKGLEFEFSARPTENLTFDIGGSYIDATLDTDVVNLKAKKGDHAPYVPRYQINTSTEYRQPIGSGEGFVWGN